MVSRRSQHCLRDHRKAIDRANYLYHLVMHNGLHNGPAAFVFCSHALSICRLLDATVIYLINCWRVPPIVQCVRSFNRGCL